MGASDTLGGSRYWVSGHPDLVAQWHLERNATLTPETVSAGSGRLIWWRCPSGEDQVWRARRVVALPREPGARLARHRLKPGAPRVQLSALRKPQALPLALDHDPTRARQEPRSQPK